MLAALCASRRGPAFRPRFFLKAQSLGAFSGDPEGPESRCFHQRELRCAFLFYATLTPSGNQALSLRRA